MKPEVAEDQVGQTLVVERSSALVEEPMSQDFDVRTHVKKSEELKERVDWGMVR